MQAEGSGLTAGSQSNIKRAMRCRKKGANLFARGISCLASGRMGAHIGTGTCPLATGGMVDLKCMNTACRVQQQAQDLLLYVELVIEHSCSYEPGRKCKPLL